MIGKLITAKVAGIGFTAALSVSGAAAATGNLPAGAQDAVSGAASHLGFVMPKSAAVEKHSAPKPKRKPEEAQAELPNSADLHARSAEGDQTHDGRAVKAPNGDDRHSGGGESKGGDKNATPHGAGMTGQRQDNAGSKHGGASAGDPARSVRRDGSGQKAPGAPPGPLEGSSRGGAEGNAPTTVPEANDGGGGGTGGGGGAGGGGGTKGGL